MQTTGRFLAFRCKKSDLIFNGINGLNFINDHYKTAGDIWILLLLPLILVILNFALTFYRLCTVWVSPDTDSLGSNFLQEVIDDPLEVQ